MKKWIKNCISLLCIIGIMGTVYPSFVYASENTDEIQLFSTTTSYSQRDSRWSSYSYGKGPGGSSATIGSSGCALLSLTNAVYHLTGNFINPKTLADFSVKNGYRINGVGTSHSFFKGAASEYGSKYGFKYSKVTTKISELKTHLQNGGVATCVQPGHFMAITKYNKDNGKYLLLDSYPSSNRGTSSGYAWKTSTQLSSSLGITKYFLLTATKVSKPSKPTINKVSDSDITSTSIKISWNSVSGATKYKVRGRRSDQEYSDLTTTTGTSYTQKNLTPGKTYYYKVYAINDAGTSEGSVTYEVHTPPQTPSKPTAGQVTAISDSAIKVTWNAVSGATKYEIKRRKTTDSDKSFKTVGTSKTAEFTDKGLSAGTKYEYRIVAVLEANLGPEGNRSSHNYKSDESPTKTKFTWLSRPKNVLNDENDKYVDLSWSKANGGSTYVYNVYRDGKLIKEKLSGTSYTDTGATPGKIHTYQITVLDTKDSYNKICWSDTFYAGARDTDEMSLATYDKQSVLISWNKPSGGNNLKYIIKKWNGSSYDNLATTTDTYYIDNGLTEGTTYQYYIQIRDSNDEYVTSIYSKKITLSIPDLGSGFYANITTKTGRVPVKAYSDANVALGSNLNQVNTLWKFERDSDGTYKISSVNNGWVLDAYGWGNDNGTNISVSGDIHDDNKSNQRWYLFEKDGGYVLIPSYNMNIAFDVSGGVLSNCTNIQLWSRNNSAAQIFNIEKVDGTGITAPTVGVTTGDETTETKFSWNSIAQASSYKLTIYQNGNVYQEETTGGTEYSILLPDGEYTATVTALNNYETASSDTVSFTLGHEHTYGEWIEESQASCTADGIKYRECTICGNKETDIIPKSEHSYQEVVTEPTCTEEGKREFICENCGDCRDTEIIEATGHTFPDEWVRNTEGSCTEEATEYRECSVCGEKETRSTEPTDHEYVMTDETEPTLDEPGTRTYTCSICQHTYVEEWVNIVNAGTVSVGGASPRAGEIITVPVSISENPGIAGFEFTVNYDKSVLTPTAITRGTLTTSGTFDSSVEEDGSEFNQAKVVWYDAENLTVDGVLFNVTFEVNANASEGNYLIWLDGTVADEEMSDVVPSVLGNVITIADVIPGDVNQDRYVNANDSVLLANYLITDAETQATMFTQNQRKAANLYHSSVDEITIKDGIRLLQLIAGYDISDEAELQAQSVSLFSDTPVNIEVGSFEAEAGEHIYVPVFISDNTGIAGFNLKLNYDTDYLTPVSIAKGDILVDGNFSSNISEDGDNSELEYVTAFWNNSENITDDGELFTVEFEVSENAQIGQELSIDLTYDTEDLSDMYLNSVNASVVQSEAVVVEYADDEIEPDVNLDDGNGFTYGITDWSIIQNSETCDEIPVNGNFDLSVSVYSTEEFTSAIMISALYDENNRLIGIKSSDITEEILYDDGVFTQHIDETTAEIDNIKIMVWNSFDGMLPLSDVLIISQEV